MSTDSSNDFSALLRQLMDIWILPEIRRRQTEGALPTPVDLLKAQVIFFADGRAPVVRINDEVRAVYSARLREGIEKRAGEAVMENEVDGIDNIVLTDRDDPDAAHITALRLGPRWFLAVDLRYNKKTSREHLETAHQFFSAAEHSFGAKNMAAFIDNAFSTAELYVKASFLQLADPEVKLKPTHRLIQERFTRQSEVTGVSDEYIRTYNRLAGWRPNARYLKGNLPVTEADAGEIMGVLRELRRRTVQNFGGEDPDGSSEKV